VAPSGVAIHPREFAEYAGSDEGDRAVIDGARAMAMTVVDLWLDNSLRDQVAAEFSTLSSEVDVLA
ncbi:MAG: amidohydrolase, partial [Ilumatobacteraceae bacterium]